MDDQSGRLTRANASPTPPSGVAASTEATRYFAAAAYHDAGFRKKVLEFVRHGWYRARAPEFGIDEALVVSHCRRAERRERIRDALMLLAFGAVAYNPLYWVISDPEHFDEILAYFAPSLIFGVIAAGVVLFVERLMTEHYTMARTFNRQAFASAPRREPQAAGADGCQNLVVYGGYSPFVGSGYSVGGWSFSVNLDKTKNDFGKTGEVLPFTTRELLGVIESRLDRLRVDGLQHFDVLFADGRLIRDDAAFFLSNGQPRRNVDPDGIARLEESPRADARSYLCINVLDWSGEIIISIYLRFKKGEANLFTEATYFLLAPPKRSFFKIDEADPQLRLRTIGRIFFRAGLSAAFMLIAAVFRLVAWAEAPIRHWSERRRIRRLMKRNPRFNLGAVTTIRELGMENYYRVYFQQLDKERHVKTIEQCLIDEIVDFLDAHNIDTSDIRDRRSTILNNGVIVSGGNISTTSMAVGTGAKSVVSRLSAKMGIATTSQSAPAKSAA